MALEPAKLSDFKLGASLGSGATARVYDAIQTKTGRPVAIKVMEESGQNPEMRERFAREALLLAEVESRHVGKILGFGFDKGQPFLVLERLHGETLDAKLRRDGPVPARLAVRWIEQLIIGIRDCHDANIIHRDIKPSNIYLHRDGFDETVKVIDFGVARLREITDDGGTGGLTSTNHLIGSMGYMAPEQFRNAKSVGFPADLYALGVVVFRTVTGRLPFVSRSLEAVIRMKSEQVVPAISSMPGMVKNTLLDWFVQKATRREPSERFQSAREMLEHWWNVMASLDEDGTTDIMRGIGRVDESYTGPVVSKLKAENAAALAALPQLGPGPVDPDDPDDHTVRRPARAVPAPPPAASRPAASPPAGQAQPSSERTIHQRTTPMHGHPWEDAPRTERSPESGTDLFDAAAAAAHANDLGDDPLELPTRSDPNLRKLVEAELALQRAQKESK